MCGCFTNLHERVLSSWAHPSPYNCRMRAVHWAFLAGVLAFFGCQAQSPAVFSIVDGSQVRVITTDERTPPVILARAGVLLGSADQVLLNGVPIAKDDPLPAVRSATLQVQRAINVSINGKSRLTTSWTIGEALAGTGIQLHAADGISPPPDAVISGPVTVQYTPARELAVQVDAQRYRILSAAPTVCAALARAGLPLLGLDYSKPAEGGPLPDDGQIQVVRVSESMIFAEKSLPFQNEFKDSADVELGQEQILQPGLAGLAVSRVRIRYENGQEISRQTETETVVRPPQDRITVQGTKIVVKTTTVNGVTIQYWRQLQMYATTYSPCNSGTGSCSSGTASGLPAGKGVVAVDPALYAYLNGQRLYIPGYGRAVIGDIGGGYLVEQSTGVSRYRWIDLGFNDNNIGNMSGWITVYFLAPAPATIPDILK
jgi:resuscitation-promoting factor RpfB